MNNKMYFPRLRFKEFSDDWESKKYNEIYSFFPTNSFSRDKLNYENGEVKNIHYGDIHTKFSTLFDIDKEEVPYVNNGIDLNRLKEENYLREGDLLIADASEDYNDIGKTIEVVNLNNERVISGLHTFHARPDRLKMKIGYSGYMLQSRSVRKQVMKIAQGTKVLGLATGRLGKIKLFIPKLPEQQKIASFLSSVDKKIKLLQDKKTLLEQYKKGVMQQLFSQQLRFKDDKGNEYPDWEEKRLGKISEINKGTQLNSEFLNDYDKYPCVNGGINASGYTDNFNRKQNTITISEGGNSCGYVNFIKSKFWCGGHCYSIDNIYQNINNDFLYQTLKFNQRIIMRLRVGSGLPNIQKKDILNYKILIPILDEQVKIANFLSAIDKKIELVQSQIDNTQQFKKGLLQQMFI